MDIFRAFVLALFLLFPARLLAQTVDYCVRLTNVADYPDSVFVSSLPTDVGSGFGIFTGNNCLPAAPEFNQTIYAIPQSDFDESQLSGDTTSYLVENPAVARGILSISAPTDPAISRVVANYSIDTLTPTALTTKLIDQKSFDANGSIIISSPIPSPRPAGSNGSQTASTKGLKWFQENWTVALPLAGSIIIGLIIVLNIAKKRPTEAVVQEPTDEVEVQSPPPTEQPPSV